MALPAPSDTEDFDPTEFLAVEEAVSYELPECLLLDRWGFEGRASQAPRPRAVMCPEEEVSFCRRLDDINRLALLPPRKLYTSAPIVITAVYKTPTEDRGITDARGPNWVQCHLRGSSQTMPLGAQLGDVFLLKDEGLRVFLADLKSYYN